MAHDVNKSGQTVVKYMMKSYPKGQNAEVVTHHNLFVEQPINIEDKLMMDNYLEIELEYSSIVEHLSTN